MKATKPIIGLIMGSNNDWPIMQQAALFLESLDISFEVNIVSAHRTPKKMIEYATTAKKRGLKIIIAGAGGAAHLPGMIASCTILPVIGVPIKSSNSIDGWDSILSILQMPNGVPVATVALNAAQNAGILAAQILAINDTDISKKMLKHKLEMEKMVIQKEKELKKTTNSTLPLNK